MCFKGNTKNSFACIFVTRLISGSHTEDPCGSVLLNIKGQLRAVTGSRDKSKVSFNLCKIYPKVLSTFGCDSC